MPWRRANVCRILGGGGIAMKLISVSIAVAMLLGCGAPPPDPGPSPEDDRAALMAADLAWSESSDTIDAHMAFYADDAQLLGADEPAAVGVAAIREGTVAMFGLPNFALSWKASMAKASGDMGYTIGTFFADCRRRTRDPDRALRDFVGQAGRRQLESGRRRVCLRRAPRR